MRTVGDKKESLYTTADHENFQIWVETLSCATEHAGSTRAPRGGRGGRVRELARRRARAGRRAAARGALAPRRRLGACGFGYYGQRAAPGRV